MMILQYYTKYGTSETSAYSGTPAHNLVALKWSHSMLVEQLDTMIIS